MVYFPLIISFSLSSLFLFFPQYQENHYSNDAVEKSNENRKIHGNCTWVKKRNLTANDRQEVKLGSQKPPKDGNESQTHGLSNALLHSSVRKVEIVLILSQKVIQSRISVFFAVFICFLDGIVRIVVFLAIQGWTGHDGSGTQRGAPSSSIFLFNF